MLMEEYEIIMENNLTYQSCFLTPKFGLQTIVTFEVKWTEHGKKQDDDDDCGCDLSSSCKKVAKNMINWYKHFEKIEARKSLKNFEKQIMINRTI